MKEEKTEKEIIKEKYKALNHKWSFVELIAEKLEMNAEYLRHNWFQNKFNFPTAKFAFLNTELDKRKEFEFKKEKLIRELENA